MGSRTFFCIDGHSCGNPVRSARMAQLAAKGRLAPGDEFAHESIIGSLFEGRVEAAATVAGKDKIGRTSPVGPASPASIPSS